jgi:hypothetical protein
LRSKDDFYGNKQFQPNHLVGIDVQQSPGRYLLQKNTPMPEVICKLIVDLHLAESVAVFGLRNADDHWRTSRFGASLSPQRQAGYTETEIIYAE